MKKKLAVFFVAFGLMATVVSPAFARSDDGEYYYFESSCNNSGGAWFYGSPAEIYQQVVEYAESLNTCGGPVPKIIRMAPAENPPS
ncbi:hypothetical protein ACFQ3S_02430 [Mucilaginibacter terrae]|uniref:hypothetical protein n=1 Tax=Mucilaginibacter terrae TaxID=1955052 RepID=UPI0036262C8D